MAEEVRVEKIRTQEQISVQTQEVLRKEKELEALLSLSAREDAWAPPIAVGTRRPSRRVRSRPTLAGGAQGGDRAEE